MVQLWMRWCRLCARENTSNIDLFLSTNKDPELLDTIKNVFSIDINPSNKLPTSICPECCTHIRTTMNLRRRLSAVTAMFAELLIRSEELDLNKIKTLYNLDCDIKVLPSCESDEDAMKQMIEPEMLQNNCCSELNPIQIKREEEEVNSCSLYSDSQSPSKSNESYSPTRDDQIVPRIKKKYKSRNQRISHEKTKPNYCSECHKGFLKAHNYRRHMLSDHNITIDLKPPSFVCENCGKEYRSFSALKEHEHSHSEERTLKCKYCEKAFKGITSLRAHEDTHQATNYICVVCGLKLNTKQTLRMHMLVHSDQKKHKCDFCGNEYKRAKALKTHLILHAGLKPYSCDFCDKKFANGANCRSHKKKNHPIALSAQEAAGKNKVSTAVIPKLRELKTVTAIKAKYADRLKEFKNLCGSEGATFHKEQSDDSLGQNYQT